MATLLITRTLPGKVLAAAQRKFEVTVRDNQTPMDVAEARGALLGYDAVLPTLGDAFGGETFAGINAPRCRILANFGVGYNHIDVAAAAACGVVVSNTPGAVTDATADLALTLILMTARRAGEGERLVRSGRWRGWHPTQMLGLHVSGKTLGVIGLGRIGRAIAARCQHGLGMRVVFFNRSKLADPPLDAVQLGSMIEVAAAADVLVVAVPGGETTHHLIGAEIFAAMRRHGVFVNISRGDVVDETALIAALQDGEIAGAGLDVYEFEPEVPKALRVLENVVLLPHLGTNALEVREAMGMMAVENLVAFFDGRAPLNRV